MTNEKILLQLEKGYDIKNPQLAQALSNLEDKIGITKAELEEVIETKANLVGGKVPAEELPSYVDDVVEFVGLMVPTQQISMILTTYHDNYKNATYFINGQTSLSGAVGDKDNYPNMFINFGENNSEDDWTVFEPEEGKIYVSTENNHSYRWTGSQLIDLDSNWSQGIEDLQENTVRTDSQDLTDVQKQQARNNIRAARGQDIQNITGSAPTLSIVGGVTYVCGELTTLTVNSIEDSTDESWVYFTSGSTPTIVTWPTGANIAGDTTIVPNVSYEVCIRNSRIIIVYYEQS